MGIMALQTLTQRELVAVFHRAANHYGERDKFLWHFALAVMFASPAELNKIRGAALLIIQQYDLQ
jgi:hypothetical protein